MKSFVGCCAPIKITFAAISIGCDGGGVNGQLAWVIGLARGAAAAIVWAAVMMGFSAC